MAKKKRKEKGEYTLMELPLYCVGFVTLYFELKVAGPDVGPLESMIVHLKDLIIIFCQIV